MPPTLPHPCRQRVARSNYGQEAYYKLASSYYGAALYLDDKFFA
jgi:hypothetical protein